MDLKGKAILITGGASGIGLEAARQFLELGMGVIVTGRNEEKLEAVRKQFPGIIAIKSDVSSTADVDALYKAVGQLGGIDILYNNAGVMGKPLNLGHADQKHLEVARQEIDSNYLGIVRINNVFMDMLKSRPEAAIINTASILSYVPLVLAPTYSASKAAVRFYTDALREHLSIIDTNIKVFELSPPLVATAMADGIEAKAISPEVLVKGLIAGLRSNTYKIRIGDTKIISFLSRFLPGVAWNILNKRANTRALAN